MARRYRRRRRRRLAACIVAIVVGVSTGSALGYWTGGPGQLLRGSGAAAATSVNAGPTPVVDAQGSSYGVTWNPATMSSGAAVSGYQVQRYDAGTNALQTIGSSCAGTISATSCTEAGVPAGSWRYTVTPLVGSNWRGAESNGATPPAHSLSLNSPSGAYLTGSTLYYKANAVGSFKLVDALSDSDSGPASATYPAIATTGWTHGSETVTTPSGGPYTSTTFSWTAGPTNPAGYTISGKDTANNTATTSLSFTSDTTAPSGGSVSYANGMVYQASVPVTTANGTDAGSGLNAGSGTVKRAQATLNTSAQTCGSFGGFTTTVTLSGGADTSVVSGNCYQYQYLVSDNVGNQANYSSGSIAKVDTTSYANTVLANGNLINFWRLGETAAGSTFSSDTMTGSAGSTLQSHSGETGATWIKFNGADSVITDANRLRKNTFSDKSAYYSSGVPASPDYTIEADVTAKSIISNDAIGVVGRQDTSNGFGTFYFARYETIDQSWNLGKYVNGSLTYLNYVTGQALTPGQSYHLKLAMSGSSLSVYVNDVLKASATDSSITAAGRAGVRLGQDGNALNITNTTGLHLDNFSASTAGAGAVAADSKGTNTGTYVNSPTLGAGGAISGDSNTAVSFDGVNEYVTAARQISDDFSIEFWFKSTQGLNTNSQWWGNAGLVDGEVSGTTNDFGVSLRSDGKLAAGTGNPDRTILSSSGGYDDGNWHQVVFTRTRATGALTLYVDGASAGTATGGVQSLTAPTTISLGRIATGLNYFAGTLDEVALYNAPLSQATVTDHYSRR